MKPRRCTPFALSSLAAVFAGCASSPPPRLEAPGFEVTLFHRSGGSLARAAEPVTDIDASHAFGLRIRGCVIGAGAEVAPVALSSDVARTAQLLLEPVTDDPIRGALLDVGELRVATGEDGAAMREAIDAALADPTRGIVFYEGRGALPDHVVVNLRLIARDGVVHTLSIARDGDSARLSIGREVGFGARADDLVLLESRPLSDRSPIVVAAPDGADWIAFECVLEPGDPDDPEHLAAVARCALETAEGVAELVAATAPFTHDEAELSARERAWQSLEASDARVRRAALLVLLGDASGFARDFATSVDDALVEAWIERIRATIDTDGIDDAELRWAIERTAIELCAERIDQTAATPAEHGLLLRHYGEVGRFAVDLARYARAVGDQSQFVQWAIEENRRLLGSSDPAARVRSFDWLAQRGAAPAGYDPFDDRDTRRDALRRATDEQRAATRRGLDMPDGDRSGSSVTRDRGTEGASATERAR